MNWPNVSLWMNEDTKLIDRVLCLQPSLFLKKPSAPDVRLAEMIRESNSFSTKLDN